MAQFKKGDEVVRFLNGDRDQGVCYVSKFIVKSCGAQKMTVERMENGKMLKSFIYSKREAGDTYNGRYDDIFLLSDFKNAAAIAKKAKQYSTEYIKEQLAHVERRITENKDRAGSIGHESYMRIMYKKLDVIKTVKPSFVLVDEVIRTL